MIGGEENRPIKQRFSPHHTENEEGVWMCLKSEKVQIAKHAFFCLERILFYFDSERPAAFCFRVFNKEVESSVFPPTAVMF